MTFRELIELVYSDISDIDAPADFLLVREQVMKEREPVVLAKEVDGDKS